MRCSANGWSRAFRATKREMQRRSRISATGWWIRGSVDMYEEYDDGSAGGSSLGRKIALGVGVLAVVAARVVRGDEPDRRRRRRPGQTRRGDCAIGGAVPIGGATDDGIGRRRRGDGVDRSRGGRAVLDGSAERSDQRGDDDADHRSTDDATADGRPDDGGDDATAAVRTRTGRRPGSRPSTTWTGSPSTGCVPDADSKAKLESLAVANARDDTQRSQVINNLTINPAVPRDVGARVVELTSARFPDGSATVSLEQAAELNRVVNVMNLLPNISALVIGHADQRGSEVANYVLSSQRAQAVVNYMVSQGIDPARLSVASGRRERPADAERRRRGAGAEQAHRVRPLRPAAADRGILRHRVTSRPTPGSTVERSATGSPRAVGADLRRRPGGPRRAQAAPRARPCWPVAAAASSASTS